MNARHLFLLVGASLMALVLSGCGAYELRGRVISGDASYITLVDANDPILSEGAGLGGAVVSIEVDPDRLNRKPAGSSVSGPDGGFATEFTEPGGGLLEYDVAVRVARSGYQTAEMRSELPRSGKRLLVVLAPGRDAPGGREEDPYDQAKRFSRD